MTPEIRLHPVAFALALAGAAALGGAAAIWMRAPRGAAGASARMAPRAPAAVPEARFEEPDRRHRGGAKYD